MVIHIFVFFLCVQRIRCLSFDDAEAAEDRCAAIRLEKMNLVGREQN